MELEKKYAFYVNDDAAAAHILIKRILFLTRVHLHFECIHASNAHNLICFQAINSLANAVFRV